MARASSSRLVAASSRAPRPMSTLPPCSIGASFGWQKGGLSRQVATLMLHIVFGVVLGGVYGLLGGHQTSTAGYSR